MDIASIKEHWEFLTGALGTVGAAWATLTIRGKNKAERIRSLELELAELKILLSSALGEDRENMSIDRVRDMLVRRHSNYEGLKAGYLTMPRIVWVKRRESAGVFTMVQVSSMYARYYLGDSPEKYAGKKDSDIWSPEVAKMFAENDEKAFISRVPIEVNEPVYSPHTNIRGTFIGVKWVFYCGQMAYVAGIGEHVPANDG